MIYKKIATNTIWTGITQVLGRGSIVAASMILAKRLDTNSFAAYSYFQITVTMLASYASMGVGITASRFFAEFNNEYSKEYPPIGTLWLISIISGAILSIIIFCFPSNFITGNINIQKWILSIGVIIITLSVVPNGGILGLEQYRSSSLSALASSIILITGSIIASELNSKNLSIFFFILANIVQTIGNSIIILKIINIKLFYKSIKFKFADICKIFNYTFPMVGVTLLSASAVWIVGRIILENSTDDHQFALYAIGIQWFTLTLFIPGMLARVLLPIFVKNNKIKEQNRKIIYDSTIICIVIGTLMSILIIFFNPIIIKFYGPKYTDLKLLVCAFSLAALPCAPSNTLSNAIIADNGQKEWFLATCIWFLCVISLALTLSKKGALGGAIAFGCSYLILTVLAILLSKKRNLI